MKLQLSKKAQQRLTFIAIVFGFTWAIVYPFISPWRSWDFDQFLLAGSGESLERFYYAPWTLPFFAFLSKLDYNIARSLAFAISSAGFLLALHVFKGNKGFFFISYPFLFSMYYGQTDGIYAASLAIMLLALRRNNIIIASLAWMMASGKFYIGIPLGLGLWWYFAQDNRARLQIVGLMVVYTLLSFVLWPNWLPDLIERARAVAPLRDYSLDLWSVTGPVILLLWIPVFLSRTQDYRWWVATWTLTVPYLHIHGLAHLLVQPVGWIGWLVQLNFFTGLVVSHYLMIIPLYIYLRSWEKSWSTDWLSGWLHRWRSPQPLVQETQ